MKKTSAKMQVLWFFYKKNGYGKQETQKQKSQKKKP